MKALKHSPEWNPMPEKQDKHGQIRLKKAALHPTPYSDMNDLQVHARGRLPSGARADFFHGKGAETLFVNMGDVRNADEVMHKAHLTYNLFINNKKNDTVQPVAV